MADFGVDAEEQEMPLEVGLWRVDGSEPVKVASSSVPLESMLEAMIEADPTILGTPLLLIGRQVSTDYGKIVDLLAVDDEGALHVLELKRDKTPRDVVAQVLDYASWVQSLSDQQVRALYGLYKPGQVLEQAWSHAFGGNPPDELNVSHHLTVVASDLDPATERIIEYLAGRDVPINAVFFRYFSDDGRAYLARTWLLDAATRPGKVKVGPSAGSKEVWNEQDWYASFGEEDNSRNWDDARRYGFISAGGGEWFSKTLKKLPEGARVFVCIPKTGYVGVGMVVGPAQRFDQAKIVVAGQERNVAELELNGSYQHSPLPDNEDAAEYLVPIKWEKAWDRKDAVWVKGMFANENSVCKLRNRFTLDALTRAFGLEGERDTEATS